MKQYELSLKTWGYKLSFSACFWPITGTDNLDHVSPTREEGDDHFSRHFLLAHTVGTGGLPRKRLGSLFAFAMCPDQLRLYVSAGEGFSNAFCRIFVAAEHGNSTARCKRPPDYDVAASHSSCVWQMDLAFLSSSYVFLVLGQLITHFSLPCLRVA